MGQETYRTDVAIANSGGAQNVIAYRAGDCYLQNADEGIGRFDANGAVSCVAAADPNANPVVPGSRIEQLLPLTAGSHRQHDHYSTIWSVIGSARQMNDMCNLCDTYEDNGEGSSWALAVPAGVHTDAAGGFVTTVKIPSNTPAGNHTITAATGSVAASTRSASAAIVVIRTLSFTGRGTSHLVSSALPSCSPASS